MDLRNIRMPLNFWFFIFLYPVFMFEVDWRWHINWGPGPCLRLKVVHVRHVLEQWRTAGKKGMREKKIICSPDLASPPSGEFEPGAKKKTHVCKNDSKKQLSSETPKPPDPSLIRLDRRANIPSLLAWLETYPPYDCLGFRGTSPMDRNNFLMTIFSSGVVKTRPGNWCTQLNRQRTLRFLRLPLGNSWPVSWMLSVSRRSSNWEAICWDLTWRFNFCIAALPSPHGFLILCTTGDLMADLRVSTGPTPLNQNNKSILNPSVENSTKPSSPARKQDQPLRRRAQFDAWNRETLKRSVVLVRLFNLNVYRFCNPVFKRICYDMSIQFRNPLRKIVGVMANKKSHAVERSIMFFGH